MATTATSPASSMQDPEAPPAAFDHHETHATSSPSASASEKDPRYKEVGWNSTASSPTPGPDVDPLDDPEHPQGWSKAKRLFLLIVVSTCSLCVTCTSSIVASSYRNLERELNISSEVAILSLSLFVLGLGVGPIFIAPLSEVSQTEREDQELVARAHSYWIFSSTAVAQSTSSLSQPLRFSACPSHSPTMQLCCSSSAS